jgi:hypothetical protein
MKKTFGNFLKEAFLDVDSQTSSKRIVVFLCMIAILITWATDLWCKLTTTEFIFEGLLYIVIVGLGVATAEKFSRK